MVQHNTIDHTGVPGVSSGSVATDAIWDAAGDLAVGTGANTAARVAIGAAGGAVSRINGAVAWNSGTSFPGSAATGDRYWRTDRQLEYTYDGTRWVCTCLHELNFTERTNQSQTGFGATGTLGNATTLGSLGDIFVEDFIFMAFASSGAFDGTNNWTVVLDKLNASNTATTISTLTLNSQTSNNWKEWLGTVDAVVAGSAHLAFRIQLTKNNAAPNLICAATVTYRRVG